MLFEQYKALYKRYNVPVLLVMLGDDFRYTEFNEFSQQHDNYAKLFEHMNANFNIGEFFKKPGNEVIFTFRSAFRHNE